MKTIQILTLLFIIGNANPVFSQDSYSQEGLIADANSYRNMLSSKHINPFTKINKAEFNRRIDSLISIIPLIDKDRFTVELFKINSMIEDEHTILFPAFEMEMPFQFERFDECMTIIASDSASQKYLLHRVLSIDGNSWSKIDALYSTIIKRDNPSYFKYFETYYFNSPEILKGLGIISNSSSVQFQLLSPAGDTVNTTVNAKQKSHKTAWEYAPQFKNLLAYKKSSNYWYSYDEKNKILYFNYQHCSEDKNETFEAFNKRLFQTIKEAKPDKIILDFRFNGGGNSGVLKPFIQSIKKNELNAPGRFFVLIGRQVMSSSLMNVIELKQSTHAMFVGEETGGNINHFGELKSFELPNSKIRVTYSTKYWKNWKNHNGSFQPDIETSNSLLNFLRSYDEAIEMIIQR